MIILYQLSLTKPSIGNRRSQINSMNLLRLLGVRLKRFNLLNSKGLQPTILANLDNKIGDIDV